MIDKQRTRDVVADLTWAELYTSKVRKELKTLIPIIKKISVRPELVESAIVLRQQLENTNRTISDLKALAGIQ
jgi:hypothetical protein